MSDEDLRAALRSLDPKLRDSLRRLLVRDQADRDAVSSHLLHYRDHAGDTMVEIVDMLTLHPEERQKVVRMLGEIEAESR